jgi:DNA repair exonuclease SbcCD ATPase subunit
LEARLEQRRVADAARQAEQDRRADWERRRGELEAACVGAESQLREALMAHGTAPDEGEDLDHTYERYIEACRQRAARAAQAGRKDDLVGRLNERRSAEDARAKDLTARRTAEGLLATVAAEAGYPSPESSEPEEVEAQLRDWLNVNEEREVQHRKQEESIARLDQLLDGHSIEELSTRIAERMAAAGDPPSDEVEHLDDQSGALQRQGQEVRWARDDVAELAGQIEVAGNQLLDVSAAIEAEARAEAEVTRLTTLAEDLDRASAILEEAQQKVHADIAPVLNETVRPWVPRITAGRYDDIRVDPATLEIDVREAGSGQYRTATVLSHGTTEQLFLLLRLALAQHLTTTGETAPIVLDDVTVQSDATRTTAILELLHELSSGRQVVLFSQEDEVLSWAEANLDRDTDRLIRLG